jgi:Fic family protein
MAKTLFAASQINSLRERYYRALSGKEALVALINETEVSEHVYNSNAIENSTLSLEETEKILLQVELDRYVNEREIFEAKNLARVMTFVDTKAKAQELNLETILLLHKMLISNIDDSIAGRFRTKGEYVRVGNYIAPAPEEVVSLLERMIVEFQASAGEEIVSRIARLHLTFEHIHPFCDGNGRIGRVLNNYLLIRGGYVPINIKFADRREYYQAFKDFDTKQNIQVMSEIVARALSSSYHKRLAYLEGKKIITLSEYSKVNKVSHSGLINKAKRQTIEAFLEKGVWKIGV